MRLPAGLAPADHREVLLTWIVGSARAIDRDTLRARLGPPVHVETNERRTSGGDEEWWIFRDAVGRHLGVCLRVPYREVVLYASEASGFDDEDLATLLAPWQVARFERPERR
jgi:hypothetical protein